MKEEWAKIEPSFPSGNLIDLSSPSNALYFSLFEQHLINILKKKQLPEAPDPYSFFHRLNLEMPLIDWTVPDTAPGPVTMTLVCIASHTQGVGRYFFDICSRSLIPGSNLLLSILQGINFRFKYNKEQRYFLCTVTLEAKDAAELEQISKNIAGLAKKIQLNLNAVKYTRQIVANHHVSHRDKPSLIQENLATLIEYEGKVNDQDIFDQMHRFLLTASGEEMASSVRNSLNNLLNKKPEVFHPDIFKEFQKIILLLPASFMAERDLNHLTKVMFYEFFFRKAVLELTQNAPTNRHLNFKVFQKSINTPQGSIFVLGVVLAMNLLHENEIFEEKHLFSALCSILDQVEPVKGSYFLNDRRTDPVQTIYMEIKKRDGERFTSSELALIKRFLAREIHTRIESVFQPLFVYRNEEEVMRGIVDLSNQLKYVHDLPQVIITFHRQTQTEISFTVILLRLIKPDSNPIRDLIDAYPDKNVKFNDFDSKTVGLLRRKYPKEAAVFEIAFSKGPYIRKDYSVDLYKARLFALSTLCNLFGEVRDYNGGMISKQSEVLVQLKTLLVEKNLQNDHLVENFFYSLTPTYMQSLLSPKVLEHFFQLFNKSLELDYSFRPYSYVKETVGGFTLIMVASPHHSFKDPLKKAIDRLNFSSELTVSSHQFYDVSTLGYLINNHFKQDALILEETIENCLLNWQLENGPPPPFQLRELNDYPEPSLTTAAKT